MAQDPRSGAIWAPLSQRLVGAWGSFGPWRLQKHLYGIYQELRSFRVLPLDPSTPRRSPGPTAPNSLSGPRTKITRRPVRSWSCLPRGVTCTLDCSLRAHWLAGTEPTTGLLVLVPSALFGLLSCPRGWGQSARTGCAASLCVPASLTALLCSVPREDSRGQETGSACPCHPLDSGCGRPQGPEDRRGTLMSVLPAAPARLGPLLRPQCPDAAHSSSPTPRPGPPLLSSLGICLLPASKCLSSPYDFL